MNVLNELNLGIIVVNLDSLEGKLAINAPGSRVELRCCLLKARSEGMS